MHRRKSETLTYLVFAVISILAVSSTRAETVQPKIAIVYTSPHPVINDIIAGFKETVAAEFPQAKFTERHANGRTEEYSTQVLAAISETPTILAPITTPITKLAVEQSRGRFPVVFMGVTDPVGAGVATSINNPGLATGSSDLCPFEGLLQVTQRILPDAQTLGLPYNPTDQPAVFGRNQLIGLAGKFGFKLVDRQVTSASELSTEVRGLASQTDAIILAADNLMMENPALVASAALESGKPTLACDEASVEKGAVAGISVSYRDVGRAAGKLAVRVLGGEEPGRLPVAVLSSGGLVLNKQAACRAGIELPEELVASAATVFNKDFVCSNTQLDWRLYLGIFLLAGITIIAFWRLRAQGSQR